ncbi:MAG: hypothetical protein AUF67_09690 [Acidobacteria bacterium 13_1_20CM_58_21]|nr:MAG: hypothetical protein AUF67_09690 [Acidobacteria bacterium 13_1_20CM_58_21]
MEDWQKFGWLKAHKTNRNEIAELLAVADRDLGASKAPGLHNDWGFNIAYNAALQIATAALAASGYQAERKPPLPCDRLIEPSAGHRCGKH